MLLAGLLLSGCATAASSPSVMVLPAPGKPLDLFRAEDLECRQWARQQEGGQRGFDRAYMQCMYARGNQIPGAAPRSPTPPPPAPAAAPTPSAPAATPAPPAPSATPPPSGG
jgi:hypothetical protein